ncbi:putative nuclease HARBI1 [Cucumis melo var. makuwa]|uniref:Nuclease HARBI1 n=1 Tax=Cucumis melo var. makuwa TaxID=1194695 RepID=A0A5D3CVV3_CUCMM|nr:putative nuclease HARBI1 [Cucumis melo var. makuwa]TYK14389.1 putative nuclease HARBI1 [Cucumis melo var. makuwa]
MNDNKHLPQTSYDTRYRIRQLAYFRMIYEFDLMCRQSTRMDRRTFEIPCHLLRIVASLLSIEIVNVEEMVAMFLHVLADDVKNRNCLGTLDKTYIKVNVPQQIALCLERVSGKLPQIGQQYHLQEWRGAGNAPTIAKEYLNMTHSSARNVIEHAFGVLKDRWEILHGKLYCLL